MNAKEHSVAAVVASLARTNKGAIVIRNSDGTVNIYRDGSDRYAIIGVRGKISWYGGVYIRERR